MKIKDAIERLQKLEEKGETDIIGAWWDREYVDSSFSVEEWADACEIVDRRIDWSWDDGNILSYFSEISAMKQS